LGRAVLTLWKKTQRSLDNVFRVLEDSVGARGEAAIRGATCLATGNSALSKVNGHRSKSDLTLGLQTKEAVLVGNQSNGIVGGWETIFRGNAGMDTESKRHAAGEKKIDGRGWENSFPRIRRPGGSVTRTNENEKAGT